MKIYEQLGGVQRKLKAPKGQYNSFGKYNYRSCEDIVEAAKPVLGEFGLTMILSDEVVSVGDRIYVKATATIFNSEGESVSNTAFAREEESKKGMDGSQVTGTASSYARKYCLNGLFAIDDTKDADTNEYAEASNKTDDKQEQGANLCAICGIPVPPKKAEACRKKYNVCVCSEEHLKQWQEEVNSGRVKF